MMVPAQGSPPRSTTIAFVFVCAGKIVKLSSLFVLSLSPLAEESAETDALPRGQPGLHSLHGGGRAALCDTPNRHYDLSGRIKPAANLQGGEREDFWGEIVFVSALFNLRDEVMSRHQRLRL